MNKVRVSLNLLAFAALLILTASAAQAQATRTWVSGVGDDANPCSRTAPCKTFGGAISKTAPNGEIDAIDSGGFGSVTITKSITINGEGVLAGILPNGGTSGIVINAASSDTVILRNLSIGGTGVATIGINYLSAKNVVIEHIKIFQFTDSLIDMNLSTSGKLDVKDLTGDNGGISTAGAAGIRVRTSSGLARANINDSTLTQNPTGVSAENNAFVTVRNTSIIGNPNTSAPAGEGVFLQPTGGGPTIVFMENNIISACNEGARVTAAGGATATLWISNNVFTGNNIAVNTGAGVTVNRFQNNKFAANNADLYGTGTFVPVNQQ